MHRKKYERLRQHYGHDEQRFVAMYLATGGKLQEVDVSSLGEPHPAAKALYFTVNDLEAAHGRAKSLHCLSSEDVHDAPGGGIVVRPWGERSFYVLRSLEEPSLFRRKAEDRRNVHCSDPIADHLWTRIRIAAIESAPTMHLGLDGIHAN
jgi:hypothetical protein